MSTLILSYQFPAYNFQRCALFYSPGEGARDFTTDATCSITNLPASCRSGLLFGDDNYCTSSCPCESGEGTCQSDAGCRFGTYCDVTGKCIDNISRAPLEDYTLCASYSQSNLYVPQIAVPIPWSQAPQACVSL
jgi:hypothetical protein